MKTQNAPFFSLFALIVISIASHYLLYKADYNIAFEGEHGGARFDAFNDVKETYDGKFIAVGQTKSRSEGKEDFYIVLADQYCQQLLEKRLGRREKDIATAVALASDGGFVITGYTDASGDEHVGQQDAIILKLDHNLKDVWFQSRSFSTPQNDLLHDIITIDNEGYVVVGKQNNHLVAFMIDQQGEQMWKYDLDQFSYSEGFSLIKTSSDEILITGSAGDYVDADLMKILVVSLSLSGVEQWHKAYETEISITRGYDIIEMSNGNIAMSGEAYSEKYAQDGALLVISPEGDIIFSKPYGHYDRDATFALTEDYEGSLYLVGQGRGRGDKRENGWILKVSSENGDRIWKNDEKNFLGGKRRDQILEALLSTDGSLVLAGFKTSGFRSGEAWLVKIPSNNPIILEPKEGDIGFEAVDFIDEDQNGILTAGEKSYLQVTLTNNTPNDFYNLSTAIYLEGVPDERYLKKSVVGLLAAKSSKSITVPIYALDSLTEGSLEFNLQLMQSQDVGKDALAQVSLEERYEFNLPTSNKAEPSLAFTNLEFESMDNKGFVRGANIRLVGNVENRGNLLANNVVLQYQLPDRITGNSPRIQPMGDISPGESRRISVEFSPQYVYFEDSLDLYLVVLDSTASFGQEAKMGLLVEEPALRPQPIQRELDAQWRGFSDSTDIIVGDSLFGGALHIYSNHPLTKENIGIHNNGKPVDLTDQRLVRDVHDEANKSLYEYQYRCSNIFNLEEGENHVSATISSPAGEFEADSFLVNYIPARPTLHILSIGVPIERIKEYASNDANTFAEIFENAGSEYFQTIYTDLKSERRQTFERDIASTFYQLKKDYFSGKITPDDLLLVFISSHATLATPGRFQVKASNFNGFYPDLTSVDYSENIERFLKQINCQKLVFLDVFNQLEEENDDEDAKDEDQPLLSQRFIEMRQNDPGSTPVILACSPGEVSFENPELQSGIFAKAIFDALTNENKSVLDANKNNVITAQELYNQLLIGVQELVSNQTPYFGRFSKVEDFAIVQVASFKD